MTSSQIRTQLKRKAYEDAGLQPPPVTTPIKVATKPVAKQQVTQAHVAAEPQSKKQKTAGGVTFPAAGSKDF